MFNKDNILKLADENRFKEKTTSYLRDLAKKSNVVRAMYYYNPEYENISIDTSRDILLEKKLTVSKGLVHKFGSRVFFLLSYTCTANCRFCERQDRVGVGLDKFGFLKENDIRKAVEYISIHPEVNEVIFSGGDPLMNPKGLLFACKMLSKIKHIRIFRIHTKYPLQNPEKVNFDLLETIVNIPKAFYLSVHVNHPDELNDITIPVLEKIRKIGFIMLSQSVFLKGINDDVQILKSLFSTLSVIGIRPYYIYHCSKIPTTDKFVMKIGDEVKIMTELRNLLSGIAYPTHAIDLIGAIGKVIVPTEHWNVDRTKVFDYNGKLINLQKHE